mmetsp:Transcript_36025/g.95651  ORF Transcript_36025/g.95651 Transcript_36025/m.95651 type:complete len:202 (+) Transcript_36025:830-1435(+)
MIHTLGDNWPRILGSIDFPNVRWHIDTVLLTRRLLLGGASDHKAARVTTVEQLDCEKARVTGTGGDSSNHRRAGILLWIFCTIRPSTRVHSQERSHQRLVVWQALWLHGLCNLIQEFACAIVRHAFSAVAIQHPKTAIGRVASHGVCVLVPHPPALHLGDCTSEGTASMTLNTDKLHWCREESAHRSAKPVAVAVTGRRER